MTATEQLKAVKEKLRKLEAAPIRYSNVGGIIIPTERKEGNGK